MISYSEMPSDSRVWIYQANRVLNPYEIITIKSKIAAFVEQWTSHKRDVKAWGDVLNDVFIVLIADEKDFQVSGCSIDSSVHFVKALDAEMNLDLFDRYAVAYKYGDDIKVAKREEFEALLSEGLITPETTVYNNLVQTKDEMENNWPIPFKESWHSKVFSHS